MLFNSFNFLFLLIITFIIYYLPPLEKFQKATIIISSFVFYSIGHPLLTLVLVLIIAITATTSYLVLNSTATRKKLWAICGIALSIFILAVFKYSPFLSQTFIQHGSSLGEFMLMIPLPMGISFYVFKGISLVIDSFGDKVDEQSHMNMGVAQHSIHSVMYVSFFPQILEGPIQSAADFFPQISTKHLKDIDWEFIIKTFILGYFLKMVIADNLNNQTFWMVYPYFQGHSSITLIMLLFGYSIDLLHNSYFVAI